MTKQKSKSLPKRSDQQIIEDWVGFVPKLNKVRCTGIHNDRYRVDVFTYYKMDEDLYDRTKISQSYFVAVVEGEVVNLTQTQEPVR